MLGLAEDLELMWNVEKHKPYKCSCGRWVITAGKIKHETGRWHKEHERFKELRAKGLTFAEIGRQLGVSRVFVREMFAEIE